MSEEILINFTPQETRVAVMEQGVVQELHIERTANRGIVGNVYLGRVCRILPGMQSAFIDVGLERTAFLHVADIWQPRDAASEKPIEKIDHEYREAQAAQLLDIGRGIARLPGDEEVRLEGRDGFQIQPAVAADPGQLAGRFGIVAVIHGPHQGRAGAGGVEGFRHMGGQADDALGRPLETDLAAGVVLDHDIGPGRQGGAGQGKQEEGFIQHGVAAIGRGRR